MSIGLAILIIGVPVLPAVHRHGARAGARRGRIVESMLGMRMPRRPVHPGPTVDLWTRIVDMLKDPRTWGTLLYLVTMLPLGIFYFTFAVVGIVVSIALFVAPIVVLLHSRASSRSTAGRGAAIRCVASDLDLGDSAAHRHAAPVPGHRLSAWPVGEIPAGASPRPRTDRTRGLSASSRGAWCSRVAVAGCHAETTATGTPRPTNGAADAAVLTPGIDAAGHVAAEALAPAGRASCERSCGAPSRPNSTGRVPARPNASAARARPWTGCASCSRARPARTPC